jgi:uncharacterized protein (DUF342 family)
METNTLEQALELLDRRYGLVAVHKGLVPRQAFKRVIREYTSRTNEGASVSVWDLLRKEGFLTEAEVDKVLPAAISTASDDEKTTADSEEAKKPMVEAAPAAAETGVSLTVSADEMKAVIQAKAGGLDNLALAELKAFLTEHEVTHGVVADEILTEFIAVNAPGAELIVANGTSPEPGQPDQLQCHFDTDPHRIGTLLEDGTMDWKDRGEIPQANEGDLLAEIKAGRPGKPGVNVFGHVIAPEDSKKLRVRAGKGARFDGEGTKIYAARDGQPYLSLENQVTVLPVLKVQGDVGIETGHVQFDGHVEVPGAIQTGYQVRAESLAATEIHSDDVEVSGDVNVRGGVYGARIKAGGNFKAHHVNRSALLVQGDIAIKKELVDSKAEAGGRCLVDGGVILSSEVSAAKGISSGDIGSESAKDSFLQVGKDPWIKEAIAERRNLLKENQARREDLEKKIEALVARRDSVTTELGEIAQVQDKNMVAQRELQEKIKKEKRLPTAKEQVLIKACGRKVADIDETVARLMGEEEEIEANLSRCKADSKTSKDEIERLDLEIDSLTAAAKANPSHTQIRITGRIYEHTDIKGFHAHLVMKETISRCVLSEKLDSDPNSDRKWYMAIASL